MDSVGGVGQEAPDFTLVDLDAEPFRLREHRGKVIVLDFWSAECPWSERSDARLSSLEADWERGGEVALYRIAANANEGVEQLRQAAEDRQVGRILHDPDHSVADRYGAMTTPHLFVIDADGILRYRGAPNDATWREPEPSRDYLTAAVKAARRGESPEPSETPGRGCTIVRYRPTEP